MPFDETQYARVKKTLEERGALTSPCGGCGKPGDYFLNNSAVSIPNAEDSLQRGIHVVTLVCRDCGHMRFYSLKVLGLDDVSAGGQPFS